MLPYVLYCTVLYSAVLCYSVLYCTVLYCIALYHTVLYCIVLCCTVLYCTVPYRTVLYCTVLYCTLLYCTILYYTVLCCTVLYCTVLYCTVLYCTVLYCAVLNCTVLYCTVPYHTVPYCSVLYCSVLYYTQFWLISLLSFILPVLEIWARCCWLFLWNWLIVYKIGWSCKISSDMNFCLKFFIEMQDKAVCHCSVVGPVDLLSSSRFVPAADLQISWSHAYWEFSDKIWLFVFLGTVSTDGASVFCVFIYVTDIEGLRRD